MDKPNILTIQERHGTTQGEESPETQKKYINTVTKEANRLNY
jgi:hypothetical protein